MKQFIESLKRLFMAGKVNEKKLTEMLVGGKISEDEKRYIMQID